MEEEERAAYEVRERCFSGIQSFMSVSRGSFVYTIMERAVGKMSRGVVFMGR